MKAENENTSKKDILESFLKKRCFGKVNSLTSAQICERFDINPQDLREIVHALRVDGVTICSGQDGYWYSEDRAEIEGTIKSLLSRVKGIQSAAVGMSKGI